MKFLQILFICCAIAGGLWLLWQLSQLLRESLSKRPKKVPEVWPIARRAVLNTKERQLYGLMRQAFPQYEVLVKLPLTRFMQLREESEIRFWYELLSPLNVTFTLCDHSMQPFAALDLLSDSRAASSAIRLKKRAMAAAQVRYVQLDLQRLPTVRQLRDMMLSDKEQRDTSWKTSSGIPSGISSGTSQRSAAEYAAAHTPVPSKPELDARRVALQRQVQAQRMSRSLAMPTRVSNATPTTTPPAAGRDMRELSQFRQQQQTDVQSRLIRPNQYNPATIFGHDSFLSPDSRRSLQGEFTEGKVTSYTTGNSIPAEHIWLHSETSSGEDASKT
jgi:Protein of unknown function (DUF2726)